MKTHELKTWPSFFEAVRTGSKRFEIRKNDRDFALGDHLVLREFNPDDSHEGGYYSGRHIKARVGFVVYGGVFGVAPGHCVMSLDVASDAEVKSAQFDRCTYILMQGGLPYPRTCQVCGLGPCQNPNASPPFGPSRALGMVK